MAKMKYPMNKGGKGFEPWYKSRRIQGAVLAGITAVLIQLGYSDIAASVTAVAGGLFGITSWVNPKK